MSRVVVLDTHALVWWVSDPDRVSIAAGVQIAAADEVVVSAASVWEIALLVDAGRIVLDRPVGSWVQDATREQSVRHAPIDREIALTAVELGSRGFHRDPADRFIYATALRERAMLVSKDAAMRTFAEGDDQVVACW